MKTKAILLTSVVALIFLDAPKDSQWENGLTLYNYRGKNLLLNQPAIQFQLLQKGNGGELVTLGLTQIQSMSILQQQILATLPIVTLILKL